MNVGWRLLLSACAVLLILVGIMFLAAALFAPFGSAATDGPGMALLGMVFAAAGVIRLATRSRVRSARQVLDVAASALALVSALWAFGLRAERIDVLAALTIAACIVLLVEALMRSSPSIGETKRGR